MHILCVDEGGWSPWPSPINAHTPAWSLLYRQLCWAQADQHYFLIPGWHKLWPTLQRLLRSEDLQNFWAPRGQPGLPYLVWGYLQSGLKTSRIQFTTLLSRMSWTSQHTHFDKGQHFEEKNSGEGKLQVVLACPILCISYEHFKQPWNGFSQSTGLQNTLHVQMHIVHIWNGSSLVGPILLLQLTRSASSSYIHCMNTSNGFSQSTGLRKHTVSTNAHCAHMEAYPSAHPTAAADQECFLMVGRVKISSPCTDTNLFLNTSFKFYGTRVFAVFNRWTREHVGPE